MTWASREPRATIVIVNYNGAHLLPPCLDAVAAQDLPADEFETVVVDNASVDGSAELLAVEYPWVRVIKSHENLGFAGGNNLALHEVDTPYAVLLNNDAVPEPTWLQSLLAPFEVPGGEFVGAVTGKVVFLPRFVRVEWDTPGFDPGPEDPRELGVRVYRVLVGERDVTDKVLWERLAYGPEGSGRDRFRWTRPAGHLLVPVHDGARTLEMPVTITFEVMAERAKPLVITTDRTELTEKIDDVRAEVALVVPAGTILLDVINNAGGIVLRNGYGADRGFQEIDEGQYDAPVEVFNACGNGMALRAEVGRDIGWFDEDFFMYYEDTDLSWRLRSRGWSIRYEPTAVLRHIHSASSKEWSPRWVFHVDRNRLLMLVKNATWSLAGRQVAHYPLSAASMALRDLRTAVRRRARPAVRPHLLRLKVMLSFLRLAGPMLARRRAIGSAASISRGDLQEWLVERR